jgi:TonB family protein
MLTSTRDLRYPKLIDKAYLADDAAARAEFYASRSNKVFLYLVAMAITSIVFVIVLAISALQNIGDENLSRLISFLNDHDIYLSLDLIKELKVFNPLTSTLFAFAVVFVSFVIFDISRKDYIESIVGKDLFKESTAVSYSIHFVILALIMTALLFSFRSKPKVQVTSIEFVPTQAVSKLKPKNPRFKSTKSSIDSGKHDPKKEIKPVIKTSGEPQLPKQVVKPSPQERPLQLEPKQPSQQERPPQTQRKQASPKPLPQVSQQEPPKPMAPAASSPKLMTPQPKSLKEAINQAPNNPQAKVLPKLITYNPNSNTERSSGTASTPSPKTSSTTGSGDSRTSNIVARLSNIPRAPDSASGGGQGGARGDAGNPGPNPYSNAAPSVAASPDVNFGPYMSSLQRKIKLAWRPPRGTESNRIVVHFSILKNGTLVDLVLVNKSVNQDANLAALDAVSNAAPFEPLPESAGPSVDIEFTFDYNVFQKSRW